MEKENQHFVSQGYLRRFVISGEKSLIWEYDKNKGVVSRVPKSVRGVCSRSFYYECPNEDGELDKISLEDRIGKHIEDPAIRVIDKIPKEKNKPFILSDEEKEALSLFASFSLSRNPSFRDGVNEMHRQLANMAKNLLVSDLLESAPDEIKSVVEEVGADGAIKVEVCDWVSIEGMFEMAEYGAVSILNKPWMFLKAPPGKSFVTCDNPVVFSDPNGGIGLDTGIGPFHPLSIIRYPLRKDVVLVATEGKAEPDNQYYVQEVCADLVDKINYGVVRNAIQYVYSTSNDESTLNLVKELKGSSVRLMAV